MDPSKIKQRIGRFRILVIGRANAGKTTILQRVCNTRDQPEIYNSKGEKIDLTGSRGRGLHDIDDEVVFPSNPGFVFHDSRGFEAGGVSEFDKVQTFIIERSKETKITKRLHTIWFCIPMDEACRSFTAAENKFFSQCDTGSIPVIVVFTKFDALYDVAYTQLKTEGKSRKDARKLAAKRAEETFANGPQLRFLKDVRKPPPCHVCLPNMDKDDANSGPLIERTAATLDDEVLKRLFVTTQQTNLEVCMKYAIERTLREHFGSAETSASEGHEKIIGTLGAWFPHIWDKLRDDHCAVIQSKLLSVACGLSPLHNVVQLISAAVIIFEHSFYIFDKRRYLQDKGQSDPSFYVALEQYMSSPHAAAVVKGVSDPVHAYEQAVAASVKEKESSSSQAKAELINAVLEITLNHRLSEMVVESTGLDVPPKHSLSDSSALSSDPWNVSVNRTRLRSFPVGDQHIDLQSLHSKISCDCLRMPDMEGRSSLSYEVNMGAEDEKADAAAMGVDTFDEEDKHEDACRRADGDGCWLSDTNLLSPMTLARTARGEVLQVDAGRVNVGSACTIPWTRRHMWIVCAVGRLPP
ncbi:uncharacterized protein F5891DRAFT_1177438 [Suillus fuscotomentosus]|uniref:G domain-containing protein n=1 Tax=Suillus fuscotomentosus TaxID=1912939 RepID=A0AAD4DRE1_9AGAM|nr:uncharacterized protein F5891DRAFT_1177438 [Suillus fuscotomentosus]KAG1887923.1 hypothetical protein F5891DRAFT_1177438 [Suillus fuscotomentosus]